MFVDHTPLTRKLNSRRFRSVQARFFFPIARAYRCGRHSGDKSGEPLHRGPGARVSPLCRGFPVLAPSHTGRSTGQRRVLDRPLPRRPWPPFPRLCGRRTNFQTSAAGAPTFRPNIPFNPPLTAANYRDSPDSAEPPNWGVSTAAAAPIQCSAEGLSAATATPPCAGHGNAQSPRPAQL
jgi:hypothetical protein